MANNSALVNQSFQQPNSVHHCKECGLYFDSGKSLEVHLQYHKENLLNKWANQAAAQAGTQNHEETNNNNSKGAAIGQNQRPITAPADSSDSMIKTNKSPESFNNRTTPETTTTSFGHPPTPQSYNSAPSPYQNHAEGNNTSFSPSGNFQNQPNYQQNQAPQVKNERSSPLNSNQQYNSNYMGQMYQGAPNEQYFMDQQQLGYPQDYPVHKIPQSSSSFRYHPYGYDRSSQVTSSSPAYPPQNTQPTPSPSPKQCDKCGCVCESAAQLLDHLNNAHPSTPSGHHQIPFNQPTTPLHQNNQNQFNFGLENNKPPEVKSEVDEPQSEILDLDSHKVHHVFQSSEEEEELKRNGEMNHNPHSVSSMLGNWPSSNSPKMFSPNGPPQGMYPAGPPDQKMYQPHPIQMPTGEYIVHGVSTTSQDAPQPNMGMMGPQYRPYDSLPPQPQPPVISSTQLPGAGVGGPGAIGPTKSTNWKSNEARRPKTYNCSACNKWFTSSGHLKRHYNTTLHKNAVKSSGQPDPATMPISAHHHPNRGPEDRVNSRGGHIPDTNNHSPDSAEDSRLGDESTGLSPAYDRTGGGLLQQPPAGPYDRQSGLNLGPGPGPPLASPMGGSPGLVNLSAGSPPNGEAGPSVSHQQDHHLSRGLLSISTQQHLTNNLENQQTGFSLFNHQHMMGTTALHSPVTGMPDSSTPPGFIHHNLQQIQSATNYPNGYAPHAMPTAINSRQPVSTSLIITGNEHQTYEQLYSLQPESHAALQEEYDQQPLPSFAQFQTAHHRYGILLAPGGYQALHTANVGGTGPATDPIYLQPEVQHEEMINANDVYLRQQPSPTEDYEITVLENQSMDHLQDSSVPYSPQNMMTELPPSPEENNTISLAVTVKSEPKTDYEHGSPQITSTGSPLGSGKTTNGSKNTLNSGSLPNGQHKCFDCDKVFNKACYLTQHNKTFHSGDKPFKCNRCGKRFPNDQIYQEHLKKHAGDKPYKCELCPKQFNHKTDLRRHMCLHTGQKPYACEHCGKGFIRKDHMLKHAETHTRKTHHHHAKQQVLAS